MREIKFRVWDKKENEMFYSDMYQNKTSMIYGLGNFLKECSDIEEPIMQYTGLKDKNGVEIYEGDIIKYDFNNLNYRIEFINAEFIARRFYENIEDLYPTEFDFGKECEVLGNIYENPELLNDELKAE